MTHHRRTGIVLFSQGILLFSLISIIHAAGLKDEKKVEQAAQAAPVQQAVAVPQVKLQVKGAPGVQAGRNPDATADNEFTDSISLPTDRQVKKRLEAAEEDYIKTKAWGDAAKVLQSILNSKEDVFVKVQREAPGKPLRVRWLSARSEANRLLGTMPPDGLEFYELQNGAEARRLLEKAKATADPVLLADVSLRFFHTAAGVEATDLLGTYYLDRGQSHMAALRFGRLLQREGSEKLVPFTLFKAAVAYRRAGDPAHVLASEEIWKRVSAKVGREGLQIGDKTYLLETLRKELEEAGSTEIFNPYEWSLFRGNSARTGRARGSAPFLQSKWKAQTLDDRTTNSDTRSWIHQALKQNPYRSDPILPAFFPVAAAGKLIYRNYSKVMAVNIKTGEPEWESHPMTAGLDSLLSDQNKLPVVKEWLEVYLRGSNQSVVLENTTVGTLSTDNIRVYAVDDLAVPPHPANLQMQAWGGGNPQITGPMLEMSQRSRLVAIDLESGKLVWERGDPSHDTSEMAGGFFLGPPLPVGGRLYILTEKNTELKLLCLDPAKGEIIWSQTLATARDRLMQDVTRRSQAVHLAYGDGMLICPTNAGAILGIDVLDRSLVWAYPYREKSKTPDGDRGFGPGGMNRRMQIQVWQGDMPGALGKLGSDWKMSAPIIQDGKVVFTAPDAPGIYCLNLSDGDFLWQAERKDDLYLAGVYSNKVVLVGKNNCRALSLLDGKTKLWEVQTGLPSGQGVASGNQYYLPLKKGEVCTIDMEDGRIVAHNPSPRDEVPGNLLFFDGDMVSQTESLVTAYPQVESKVAQINALLTKNPKDPVALTERGELKLYQGDLAGAVADLRDAAIGHPSNDVLPRTRAKLYTTLTELLQRDFTKAEPYLKEYKDLCKIDIPANASAEEKKRLEEEQRQRQAGFLCLLAKGRENQGRLVEAFDAYLEFGSLSDSRELVNLINDAMIKAQPSVWAQGRILALLAKATPEQRKPMEAEISRRWQKVESSKDLESHRRFVESYGSLFRIGREARLKLAEQLMESNNILEAEMHLLQLRRQSEDPLMAARAIEALARMSARKGILDDAAYYYRLLGKQYAKTVIRDGKTGADLLRDLSSDKRFLPYLDDEDLLLLGGTVKATEISGAGAFPSMALWPIEPKNRVGPYFARNQPVLTLIHTNNLRSFQLEMLDRDSGERKWGITASPTPVNYLYNNPNSLRFPFYAQGHLMVLYLGTRVYAVDLLEHKRLWDRELFDSSRPILQQQPMLTLDPDGSGGLNVTMAQGVQKLGTIGAVTPSYVCLLTTDGLVALDPVNGQTLWTRTDVVPEATRIFGDDQHLFVLDLRKDNTVGSARVIRGSDGAIIDVPDFASLYQRKPRIVDGRMLLSESDPAAGQVFRLYDIVQGKDLWRKTAPANTLLLRSEDPDLAGLVEPDGKLTVVDLTTQREILKTKVEAEHLTKVNDGLLLQDASQFYVVLNRPHDTPGIRASWANVHSMRYTAVNGVVYAFDRSSGNLGWYFAIKNQILLLEQFQELPMLVFTAQFHRPIQEGSNTNLQAVAETITVDKRSGKRIHIRQTAQTQGQFNALRLDRRAGTIDLISTSMRLRHSVGDGHVNEPSRTTSERIQKGARLDQDGAPSKMMPLPKAPVVAGPLPAAKDH